MRSISQTQKVVLSIALGCLTLASQPGIGFAELLTPTGTSAASTTPSRHTSVQEHILLETETIRSGLEPFDDSPLAERTPVVLIHGIGSFENDSFHWENFLNHVQKKQDFQAKYKIYLYHYDSTRSVPAISKNLQTTLKGFIGALGGRNIKILAYSEGGLLTRNALQDAYIDAHTQEVLAIATPFHGSPLANPTWIDQQAKSEGALSLVRIGQKIAYKITGRRYPTFREDFHWDNFDGAIPMADYIKDNGPLQHTNYTLAKKNNFVTYGSYFGMDVDPAIMQKELGLANAQPKERPLLSNMFRKNLMFSLIRNNIGKLPLANHALKVTEGPSHTQVNPVAGLIEAKLTAEIPAKAVSTITETLLMPAADAAVVGKPVAIAAPPQASVTAVTPEGLIKPAGIEPVSMMMFNDGISPISSSLWLGRYTQNTNGTSIPVERLWSALKALKGSSQARLFAGLDHRNWMDGTTRTGQELIQDLLNPDEPPRTVFEWIIYDLMS